MDTDPTTDAAPRSPAGSVELTAGTRLGSHTITRLLGRGGMGEVYEARDERLGRLVALKRIGVARAGDPEARARFWREARALAALRHPGVVAVYELGEADGALFIAMELVRGRPLATLIHRPWPIRAALHVARAVAAALGAAHAAGITHRDVKPSNLIIDASGVVRVIDFGLARSREDAADGLTRSGALLGTPGYMSPELIGGAPVGPAADVFAVGALLYRLLTGVHPFARETPQATALAVAGAILTPLASARPDLPGAVTEVVARCLAVDPAARPADGAALATALGAPLDDAGGPLEPAALAAFDPATALPTTNLTPPPAARPAEVVAEPVFSTRDTGSASPPGRRPRVAAVLLAVAVVGVAAIALAIAREPPGESPAARGASPRPNAEAAHDASSVLGHAATPGMVAAAAGHGPSMPPRPAVAVLDLAAPTAAARTAADIAADVARVRLDADPTRLVAVSSDLLDARRPTCRRAPDGAASCAEVPYTEADLVRPSRAIGHIDLAVSGRVIVDAGGIVRVQAGLVHTATMRPQAAIDVRGVDAIEAGEALAAAVFDALGGPPRGAPARLTAVPEAWSAWLDARRAARRADLGVVEERLAWARRLDPDFGLARLDMLRLMRSLGRGEALLAEGEALLADPEALPPRQTHLARALVAHAAGRTQDALRELYQVTDAWPYDIDAAEVVMAIRAKDDGYHDLDEVERYARRLLALAPRLEVAASRLIRALAARDRADEADRIVAALGVPRDDPDFLDVFAEVDLHSGRFEEAAAGFRQAFAAEPGNAYDEHMAIIADLLGGRCAEAAGAALDRLERVTTRGQDAMLGWTFSVAAQALICAERWGALETVLARWQDHGVSGFAQALGLRERVALVRALEVPDDGAVKGLVAHWLALLDAPDTPPSVHGVLVSLLARTATDPATLGAWRAQAEERALDPSATAAGRASWRRLGCALGTRLTHLGGGPAAEVLSGYEACQIPWAEVQDESDLSGRVELALMRAEAAFALGEAVAGVTALEEVRDAGYARLYVTDHWLVARRELEDL